jgi:hypothetical protein
MGMEMTGGYFFGHLITVHMMFDTGTAAGSSMSVQ